MQTQIFDVCENGIDKNARINFLEKFTEIFNCLSPEEIAEREEKSRAYDANERQKYRDFCVREMGIPDSYTNISAELLPSPNADAVYERLKSVWHGMKTESEKGVSGTTLILCGKSGIGKTYFGCWCLLDLLNELDAYERPIKFGKYISVYKIVREYKKTDSFSSRISRDDVFDKYTKRFGRFYDFYVLDEVGLDVTVADYERSFLYDFFDACRRGVIICTNKSATELKEFLSDTIYDRIRAGKVIVPNLSGLKSWRSEIKELTECEEV